MSDTETFEDLLDAYGYAETQVARGVEYDSDAQRQAVIDYVSRLQANQITPEIAAMVRQVMAHADLYPSEDHRLKEAIVQALWDVMEGDGG